MNRPYYALAALLAVLCGSAMAVSPARCQSATAGAAISSRSLCGASPRSVLIAAHLLVQFEAGSDAGSNGQGSDDNVVHGYNDTCGYDPYRGEIYDAEAPSAESTNATKADAGTFAEECETWPSDERVDRGYLDFERCSEPSVCGGEELHCPYFGGRTIRPAPAMAHDFDCGESQASEEDLDCQRAHEEWLAQQKACEQAASDVNFADESAFFEDDWKTAPVETPDWISEYLHGCPASLEQQYAEAELQAARDAGESKAPIYGPTLPAPAPDRAAYSDEYESLYDLDAILASESEVDDDAELQAKDNGPVVWSLGRLINKLYQLFDEILPVVEDEADEWLDSAGDALQQWEEISSQLVVPAPEDVASTETDDAWFSHDEQVVELPAEAAESRELLESLASGLRLAGKLLLSVADGLEAEAGRVLSARSESGLAR